MTVEPALANGRTRPRARRSSNGVAAALAVRAAAVPALRARRHVRRARRRGRRRAGRLWCCSWTGPRAARRARAARRRAADFARPPSAAGCRVAPRPPAGAAVAFPSDLVHTVRRLRRTRLSVVTWFPPPLAQPRARCARVLAIVPQRSIEHHLRRPGREASTKIRPQVSGGADAHPSRQRRGDELLQVTRERRQRLGRRAGLEKGGGVGVPTCRAAGSAKRLGRRSVDRRHRARRQRRRRRSAPRRSRGGRRAAASSRRDRRRSRRTTSASTTTASQLARSRRLVQQLPDRQRPLAAGVDEIEAGAAGAEAAAVAVVEVSATHVTSYTGCSPRSTG